MWLPVTMEPSLLHAPEMRFSWDSDFSPFTGKQGEFGVTPSGSRKRDSLPGGAALRLPSPCARVWLSPFGSKATVSTVDGFIKWINDQRYAPLEKWMSDLSPVSGCSLLTAKTFQTFFRGFFLPLPGGHLLRRGCFQDLSRVIVAAGCNTQSVRGKGDRSNSIPLPLYGEYLHTCRCFPYLGWGFRCVLSLA